MRVMIVRANMSRRCDEPRAHPSRSFGLDEVLSSNLVRIQEGPTVVRPAETAAVARTCAMSAGRVGNRLTTRREVN